MYQMKNSSNIWTQNIKHFMEYILKLFSCCIALAKINCVVLVRIHSYLQSCPVWGAGCAKPSFQGCLLLQARCALPAVTGIIWQKSLEMAESAKHWVVGEAGTIVLEWLAMAWGVRWQQWYWLCWDWSGCVQVAVAIWSSTSAQALLGFQYCQEVPLGRTDKTADIGGCRRWQEKPERRVKHVISLEFLCSFMSSPHMNSVDSYGAPICLDG